MTDKCFIPCGTDVSANENEDIGTCDWVQTHTGQMVSYWRSQFHLEMGQVGQMLQDTKLERVRIYKRQYMCQDLTDTDAPRITLHLVIYKTHILSITTWHTHSTDMKMWVPYENDWATLISYKQEIFCPKTTWPKYWEKIFFRQDIKNIKFHPHENLDIHLLAECWV